MKKHIKKCSNCNGLGKIQWKNDRCNCGSGEGCGIHDEIAIGLWGKTCDKCKGKGKINIVNKQ